MRVPARRLPWVLLGLVLATLWTIHLAATARTGFALGDDVRQVVGASASTVVSRIHAQLTAPFFHDHLSHIAYNTALFALGLPAAVRAYGARAVALAYLASPVCGIAVDVLLILPLAAAGEPTAVAAAPVRLVGSSIVAFACIGIALGARRPTWGARVWLAVGLILAYEAALWLGGVTRPFVWAYHLGGLALGLTAAAWLGATSPRAAP